MYIYSRTPAFGGISLALRGSAASGVTFGKPPPSAVVKEKKKGFGGPSGPLSRGACGTPNGFKNLTRSMRIPNMCLVLKSDNGKVVSIANEQNDRQTESCQHPVPYYNIDMSPNLIVSGLGINYVMKMKY